MTDERSDRLRVIQDRGARAAIALKEWDGARKALEQQIFDSFRGSDVHDAKGHQAQRFYLKVMDDVFERFEHFVITGEDARKDLIRMKRPSLVQKVKNSA